jgi:Na+/proline symporter
MDPKILASWLLVVGYVATIVVLVVRGARRNRSVADYAVGSIAFSPVAVGLALAASTTSAATFIINPGLVPTSVSAPSSGSAWCCRSRWSTPTPSRR